MVLNESGSRRRRIGAGLRPVAAIGALVALELLALGAAREAWRVVQSPGPANLDEAVLLVVLTAGALLGGWVVLSTAVACAAHVPGRLGDTARRWSRRLAPAATRRVAAILVGAALGAGVTPGAANGVPTGAVGAPASSAVGSMAGGAGGSGTSAERSPGFALTLAPADPVPGWTPSRPVHQAAAAARLVLGTGRPAPTQVVVHRGDSLWTIARRHLGPGATDTEVAAAWPHWYAANRDRIGPDPDLLRPGQVLRAPVGAHR